MMQLERWETRRQTCLCMSAARELYPCMRGHDDAAADDDEGRRHSRHQRQSRAERHVTHAQQAAHLLKPKHRQLRLRRQCLRMDHTLTRERAKSSSNSHADAQLRATCCYCLNIVSKALPPP
jgi:hypothetical protein